jgi:hypothetical protein
LIAILLFCGSIGFGQDVRYNYLPDTDFAKFKTYKWVKVPGREYPQTILDKQIMDAIDVRLREKGFTATEGEDADLIAAYQVSIDKETVWNAYGTGWRVGMRSASATKSVISIGTLVLDFYDLGSKQQVWTGSAAKQLDPSKNPEKDRKNLQKAMAKLLKNFPPKSKK